MLHKDYRLNGFPTEKLTDRSSLTYGEYLQWLADYLYETDVEVGEKQRPMLEGVSGFDPAGAL